MRSFYLLLFFVCLPWQSAHGAVDIALRGLDPVRLEDIYQQDGDPYIAVADAINAVGLSGHWDAIEHVFKIRTPRGWAEISPASDYLKLGDTYFPLQEKPRFIDGRLRVTDNFVLNQLAQMTGRPIYFNNLDPDLDNLPEKKESGLERFFSFLLQKKKPVAGPLLRAVAIDPGHGGLDTGVIAAAGLKEKQLNLELAEKLGKKLKMRLGVPIHLSRDGDYEVSLEQRLQTASREDVDIWLRFHAQAAFADDLSGVSLFVRPAEGQVLAGGERIDAPADESRQLAEALALKLRENQIRVNGIFSTSRLSLGRGNLPTVQLEVGYLSNPQDVRQLQQAEYQTRLVQALYLGIRTYAESSREKSDDNK